MRYNELIIMRLGNPDASVCDIEYLDNKIKISDCNVKPIIELGYLDEINETKCFIRTINKSTGYYNETWREANLPELKALTDLLSDLYDDAGYKSALLDDDIYQLYKRKLRESKIDYILEDE